MQMEVDENGLPLDCYLPDLLKRAWDQAAPDERRYFLNWLEGNEEEEDLDHQQVANHLLGIVDQLQRMMRCLRPEGRGTGGDMAGHLDLSGRHLMRLARALRRQDDEEVENNR